MSKVNLMWFRQDLRLEDNLALLAAVNRGGPVVPVFIWAPEEESAWPPGGASKWWLHHSLESLQDDLARRGVRLVLRRGPTIETLLSLAKNTGATAVFWNRRYEPAAMQRDAKVQEALKQQGLTAESYNAALWHEPWTIQNQSGAPFRVFTPYWRHCLTKEDPLEPARAPATLPAPRSWPSSLALRELELKPRLNWADGFGTVWRPGAAGAHRQLETFLDDAFAGYAEERNHPARPGTSRLSPHLHFGEVGPRQIWHAVRKVAGNGGRPRSHDWRRSAFLTELGWREFAHHLLYHFPRTPGEPMRPEFGKFRWHQNQDWLRLWQRGQTGYPLVDAGMRELWTTGWMHNRVRMIVASFLVKDLLITWQDGARWFWDTLVDADLAQNTLGWQWTAGCGADAAPFFRVFNPTMQAQKFDPDGEYIRRWCPELAKLSAKEIHEPAKLTAERLARAGVTFGKTYPSPVVSHAIAREVALEAFARVKNR